jgi:hypothetical protein
MRTLGSVFPRTDLGGADDDDQFVHRRRGVEIDRWPDGHLIGVYTLATISL